MASPPATASSRCSGTSPPGGRSSARSSPSSGPTGGKTTLLRAAFGMAADPRWALQLVVARSSSGCRSSRSSTSASRTSPRGVVSSRASPSVTTCARWLAHQEPRTSTMSSALFPRLGERLNQVSGSMSGGSSRCAPSPRADEPARADDDRRAVPRLAPVVVDEILARLPDVAASGTSVLLVEQDVDAALQRGRARLRPRDRPCRTVRKAGNCSPTNAVQESYLITEGPHR